MNSLTPSSVCLNCVNHRTLGLNRVAICSDACLVILCHYSSKLAQIQHCSAVWDNVFLIVASVYIHEIGFVVTNLTLIDLVLSQYQDIAHRRIIQVNTANSELCCVINSLYTFCGGLLFQQLKFTICCLGYCSSCLCSSCLYVCFVWHSFIHFFVFIYLENLCIIHWVSLAQISVAGYTMTM